MNISTNSWHYRLHKYFNTGVYNKFNSASWSNYSQVTLCEYFWKTVGAIIGLMSVGIITAIFTLWFLNGLTIFVLALFNIFPEFLDYNVGFGTWLIIMTIITLVVTVYHVEACITGKIKFAPDYLTKYFPKKETSDSIVIPKQLGLVGEYIKAKKSKWCPLVEVVDNE